MRQWEVAKSENDLCFHVATGCIHHAVHVQSVEKWTPHRLWYFANDTWRVQQLGWVLKMVNTCKISSKDSDSSSSRCHVGLHVFSTLAWHHHLSYHYILSEFASHDDRIVKNISSRGATNMLAKLFYLKLIRLDDCAIFETLCFMP